MHSYRRRPSTGAPRSSLVGVSRDRRRVVAVDVDVVIGRTEFEWLVLEIRLQEAESLGCLSTHELLDRLEVQLVVVVLRCDQFLERLVVRSVLDVLADGLDQDVGPVLVEEVGDRVEALDEVLRRWKWTRRGSSLPLTSCASYVIEQAQNLALQGGDTRRKLPEGKAFEPSPHTLSCRPEGYGPFGTRWPETGGSSVRPLRKWDVPLVRTKTKRRASARDSRNSESADTPFRFCQNRNDGTRRGEDRSTGGVAPSSEIFDF